MAEREPSNGEETQMLVAIMLLSGQAHEVAPSESRLMRLARERASFESHLPSDLRFEERGAKMYSMLSPDHSDALYPLGVSQRRYTIDHDANGRPSKLFCEQMHGSSAKIEWVLELEDATARVKPHGTLNLFLWMEHSRVAPSRLSEAQRASLGTRKGFALYGLHPLGNWLISCYVTPDGATSRSHMYEISASASDIYATYFPIVDEEISALGLPAGSWRDPSGAKHISP